MRALDLAAIIRARLRDTGRSAASASRTATGQADAIARIFRGHEPKWSRVVDLCQALGLELYVGPPRSVNTPDNSQIAALLLPDMEHHTQGLVRAIAAAGGDPIPPDLRDALLKTMAKAKPRATSADKGDIESDGYVEIPLLPDVSLAAGPGEPLLGVVDEVPLKVPLAGLAPWARPHVKRLYCVWVVGDSMVPTIRDGDVVAVDLGQRNPVNGKLFSLSIDAGMVVKRLRNSAGRWCLVSDNPAYEPRMAAEGDVVIGQVAWTGSPRRAERDANGG